MSRLTSPVFRFCLLFLPNSYLHLEKIYSSPDHALQRLILILEMNQVDLSFLFNLFTHCSSQQIHHEF